MNRSEQTAVKKVDLLMQIVVRCDVQSKRKGQQRTGRQRCGRRKAASAAAAAAAALPMVVAPPVVFLLTVYTDTDSQRQRRDHRCWVSTRVNVRATSKRREPL